MAIYNVYSSVANVPRLFNFSFQGPGYVCKVLCMSLSCVCVFRVVVFFMCKNSCFLLFCHRKRNVRRKVLQNDVAPVNSSEEVWQHVWRLSI